MKTAAVIVLVLALIGMFPKHRSGESAPVPIMAAYECAQPEGVVVDESRAERIARFGESIRTVVDGETMRFIARGIVKYATAHCIEPELAAALVARESRFNPRAVSKNGAMGLGQLIPSTAKRVGVSDPFDIEDNLRGTTLYFKSLLDMWSGHADQVERALASYLVGPSRVEKEGVPPSSRPYINDILDYRARILSQ
ncbi:MAG: lytic transglycosylase domain-containing protein [bacterium]